MGDANTQAAERVSEIRGQIKEHDFRYYSEGNPTITDQAYDALMRELEALEKAHPELVTPDSPTQRVGIETSTGFAKAAHLRPMLSISNVYNDEELRAFYERCVEAAGGKPLTCTVEPKFDGLAISVRYTRGLLSLAVTRGDGKEGDDVTANVRTIRNLPLTVPYEHDLELRGEVYMSRRVFEKLNAQLVADGDEPFANARNAASGALKSLDPRQTAARELSIIFYHAYAQAGLWEKYNAMLLFMKHRLQVPCAASFTALCFDFEDVRRSVHIVGTNRPTYPFDTDGAVIKVNELEIRQELGEGNKAPKWAAAFKFPPEQATTRLLSVDFQIGRTGVLTPVARLQPVLLSGSTVSNATLHNLDELNRLGVRIGDMIVIEKAGEIIPSVKRVADKGQRTGAEQHITPPLRCPYCNGMVHMEDAAVALRCGNRLCPGRVQRVMEHFCSKAVMDLKGVGPGVLAILGAHKAATAPRDLYQLSEAQLVNLPGIAAAKAQAILAAVAKSKEQPAWRTLAALGIPGVGASLSPQLLAKFGSIDKLAAAKVEDLTGMEGVGDITARDITEWFVQFENQNYFLGLKACGLQTVAETVVAKSDKLVGTKWVITGALSQPREVVESMIEAHGGAISSSVSKKTTHLLCGSDAGSKLQKAEKLGVPVLSEDTFLDMIK